MSATIWIILYLCIVSILTVLGVVRYNSLNPLRPHSNTEKRWNIIATFLLAGGLAVFIGLRPESSVFVDMLNYVLKLEVAVEKDAEIGWEVKNLIFDNALIWYAQQEYSTTLFFLIAAVIYFGAMAWAMVRIFGRNCLYAFIIFLGAFSTFSYATNGIKAGMAASIFLLGLSYYPKNYWMMVFWMLISYGVHHSMQLPIVAMFIAVFIREKNLYFVFWFLCLIISALHVTYFQTLFGEITDASGQDYLLNDAEGIMEKSGFRLDFVIYTAIPLAIYWIVTRKGQIISARYELYLRYYLLVSAIWMLCIYAPFTNRIAYLGWQVLPLVSIYPYLNMNLQYRGQYRELNIIVLMYLAFTLGYTVLVDLR